MKQPTDSRIANIVRKIEIYESEIRTTQAISSGKLDNLETIQSLHYLHCNLVKLYDQLAQLQQSNPAE